VDSFYGISGISFVSFINSIFSIYNIMFKLHCMLLLQFWGSRIFRGPVLEIFLSFKLGGNCSS